LSDDKSNMPETNPAAKGDVASPPAALPVLSYATPDVYRKEVRREGRYVVVPHGKRLPDRCIKCGRPAEARVRLSFNLAFRLKRERVVIGLCGQHAGRRRIGRRIASGAFLLALATMVATPFAWGALFFFVVGAIALALTPKLRCRRYDVTDIWLSGADKAFLDSLPAGPSEPRE